MTRSGKIGRDILKRVGAAGLAAATLYIAFHTAGSRTPGEAAEALTESAFARAVVRWELGDLRETESLSFAAALALGPSPLLRLSGESVSPPQTVEESTDAESPEPTAEKAATETVSFPDNGVPARTLLPTTDKGYIVCGNTRISTSTSYTAADIGYDGTFPAHFAETGEPQVLIFHTHGSEAYTPPPGETYESTGDHRTRDAEQSVIRVGDEIADALSAHGISVLHDRTLYDDPEYNGAYGRSLAAEEAYLQKYPGIRFVLDIHRDAVGDGEGNICKVVADEGANSPAQMTLVMGSDAGGLSYPAWRDNLHLALALQEEIAKEHPTLMRPLLLRKSRYNQHVSPGALLVEVGAAGNSLEEALASARILAEALVRVAS